MEPDAVPASAPDRGAPSVEDRLLSALEAQRPRPWLEILSAVLISLATVGSAWSAYQATRWSGQQAILQGEATALRIESSMAVNRAAAETLVDVSMFLQYADAISKGDQRLADFLRPRFRDELKPALEAWIAMKPLENPDAPPTPFAMKQYVVASRVEADHLMKEAALKTEAAKDANQINDNYILLTVAFASVLFLGGVGPKFHADGLQLGLTVLGAAVFIGVVAALATFPIH